MSGSAIQAWLARKQKKALRSAWVYYATTLLTGTLALVPNAALTFGVSKLLLLLVFPTAAHTNLWALLIAIPSVPLLFVDCIRAERDDLSIIPLWLAREYFHMGPRIILDGRDHLARARAFARIDAAVCANVLAHLVFKTTPTSRQELLRAFPGLSWDELIRQLHTINGVLIFRNVKSISLLAPLRRELRQLLVHIPRPPMPEPESEPEPAPVETPQQLTPHEILGIPTNASTAEIKTAYRTRVKECHPDRFPNLDEPSRRLAEEWTKTLNAAYAELLAGRARG